MLLLSFAHEISWASSMPTIEKVFLTCQNPLTPQTEAKTPIVTNNTLTNVSDSVRIFWTFSDGDKGFFPGPLAVSESKQDSGQPGGTYTCEAFYYVEVFPPPTQSR